jgi:purine-binding chemotaxis protein CheW
MIPALASLGGDWRGHSPMSNPARLDVDSSARRFSAEQAPALICRVRSLCCALRVSHVVETMRPQPVEALASAPGFVLGVAVIRGVAVPVVDVGALLGASEPPCPTRFITLAIGERVVALAVEGIVGVRTLPDEALAELPPLLRDASLDAIERIGTLDASLLIVLRTARIVTDALLGADRSAR